MPRTPWTLDTARSGIHFMARHMVVTKVRGSFKRFRGTIELDEQDLTRSSVDVTIEAASIDTADPRRDGELRSPGFLDVERFPSLAFKSNSIEKKGRQNYDVTGDLTLHGVTKEVVLYARFDGKERDPWGNEQVAFSARTTVNREDFGLKWSQVLEAGGVLVGTKIEVELDVQAVRSKAA